MILCIFAYNENDLLECRAGDNLAVRVPSRKGMSVIMWNTHYREWLRGRYAKNFTIKLILRPDHWPDFRLHH